MIIYFADAGDAKETIDKLIKQEKAMKTYLKIREKHDFYRYINPAHIISFKHISTPSDESSHWEIALSNGEKLHTEKYLHLLLIDLLKHLQKH